MLRIVGIQREPDADREFILLQNQGNLRVNLRGHVLVGERALEAEESGEFMHLIRDDVVIAAGHYVLIYSGYGEPKWARTKDLQLVYYAFMHRDHAVWDRSIGPVTILGPQHSYQERREGLMLR